MAAFRAGTQIMGGEKMKKYSKENIQTVLKMAVSLIVILVAGVLIWYGFKVAYAVRLQLSPALRVSMALIYGAAPVCGVFVLFYSALNLLRQIQIFRGKESGKW